MTIYFDGVRKWKAKKEKLKKNDVHSIKLRKFFTKVSLKLQTEPFNVQRKTFNSLSINHFQ